MDKQALAKAIRSKRSSYSVKERLPWDKAIHDTVVDVAQAHSIIGIYAAFKGEVDTYGIIETLLWDSSKTIALPRIEKGQMTFYKINALSDLKEGHFGVLEPITTEIVIPELMIVPLSAFNADLHRIGYGKGYYDKYLSENPCLKVGIAYDFQKIDEVFQEISDIALDAIITERTIYYDQTL